MTFRRYEPHMAGKQAKVLSIREINVILEALEGGRNAKRNKVLFLLTLHGFRACEIADLELLMLTDASGNISESISITDQVSKGGYGGRTVHINSQLKEAIEAYLKVRNRQQSKYLVTTERADKFSANALAVLFFKLYKRLGLEGASSHSGRRTFITNCAKKISQVGGSLRDIQAMVGHRWLSSTQRYIEYDHDAQKNIVELIYRNLR